MDTSKLPQTDDERLADLAELLVYVARKLRTHGHDDDRIVRLTVTESAVMRYVGKHPGATPSEAARATGIQRSNVSAALRELEAKGGRDPDIVIKKPSESKGGVAQKYIKVTCHEILETL